MPFITSNCKKDDGTNLIQLNLFSIEDDKQMGADVSKEIESDPVNYPILSSSQYPDAYGHLVRITNEILNKASLKHRNDFVWQMKIIHDDSTLNAFCTPGGYIYVYTGLIKYLSSEDQLAGVLGHEIAHADERHTTEAMTSAMGRDILVKLILGDSSVLGQVTTGLLGLKYSRGHETEADLKSVEYLDKTDYDARGAARFFEKLIASGQSGGPQFLSTHPNPDNRVEAILSKWESLGSKVGQTFDSRYTDFKNSLP
ncbi:MAG: M48 family metalloprotease [Flavobacteriales bacterium]|nr:M48 family metalloprotease [Flavobacteriales bacterium]